MGNPKNVLEEVFKYFLERSLALRFDICTCEKCKAAMLQCLLADFDPIYIDEDDPSYRKVEREVTQKYLQNMFSRISGAIDSVNANLPHPVEEDKEQALENLIVKIRDIRGVDFSQYRKSILKRRLALRLVANNAKSYAQYLTVLADNPGEYEKLFEALTINVSEFFRDPYVWKSVGDLLEKIVDENNERKKPVVLWSAGCARGEEPYSLAILAQEVNNRQTSLEIYGTDIDKDSLKRARGGVYDSMAALRNVLKGYFPFSFDTYFSFENGKYYVKDEIKELIEFKYLDLTSSEFINDVDIILCRNVFIYFTKPLQEQIVDRFYRSLREGGYLIIGETENLVPEARLVFKETQNHSRIYQKITV
ncbi:MAG: protein-glutamate O-methyltransferase CheR [Candidatus Omnitrophica bacterium]|nr:protein-glutamate O-methyltransferase CheR [Candidatus Omnitrophota bacterium]